MGAPPVSKVAPQMVFGAKAPKKAAPAFAYGLPGNFNALGGAELNFDPAGFLKGKSELEVNRYREAELTHGRVGMLASLGFLVQEKFPPLFSADGGPAIDQIPQLPVWLWVVMGSGIAAAESYRINVAFRELDGEKLKAETALRPGYVPGQIGFDPLNLAPEDPAEFRLMQEKELAHARLAMIAAQASSRRRLSPRRPGARLTACPTSKLATRLRAVVARRSSPSSPSHGTRDCCSALFSPTQHTYILWYR